MTAFTWNTSVPSTPDPTYIVVDNIALSATETNVRDFFAFCGPIESLELKKQESGTQSALLKFGNVEAAKTSLLLSNALINYEPINVSPLFPQTSQATPPSTSHSASSDSSASRQAHPSESAANTNYEGKPALYVVHELLAAGYLVGEHVVNRASEFDSKYRVTDRTHEQARSLDNQYKFSNYLQQWDEKFNITKRAKDAYTKVQSHPVGQKVLFTVNEAYQSALQLSNDAREIAERKRTNDEKLFGKIPLPTAPRTDTGASSSSTGASGSGAPAAGPVPQSANTEPTSRGTDTKQDSEKSA
ncbi:Protein vip1 [Coemansia sp. RSA 2703]|nr:Protein vip1 [Coemansia sp. RSA 2703]KAJ2376438.1 Protein vip1 [Coemansia sp. RSA 2607]KAJ2397271.1 Protein vip1 [Coemansia sp. RSA 2603]